jgi:hypothetical protein
LVAGPATASAEGNQADIMINRGPGQLTSVAPRTFSELLHHELTVLPRLNVA